MPDYQKAYAQDSSGFVAVHQKQVSVDAYHGCRYIPEIVLDSIADIMLQNQPRTVLEAGVGNGRLFVPTVQKARPSTTLIGVDISHPMLDVLEERIEEYDNITLHCTDIRNSSFFQKIASSIDVVYTFATLHILSQGWQQALDNFITILSPTGKIILGEEINAVFHASEALYEDDDFRLTDLRKQHRNEEVETAITTVCNFFQEYHRMRQILEYKFSRVNSQILHGDQSSAERYIRSHGFRQETIQSPALQWLKPHTFREILNAFEQGTVTTLGSDLPASVRKSMREGKHGLETFCKKSAYGLDEPMMIPAEIQLHVFDRDATE